MEWGIDYSRLTWKMATQIRNSNIIDPYNWVCKEIFINHSMPATRLIELLERSIDVYGKPPAIRSDNGP